MNIDLSKERILVTGATGFIGFNLVNRLISLKAKKIFTLSNDEREIRGAESEKIDLADYQKVADYIKKVKPTVVFHIGALVVLSRDFGIAQQCIDSNIKGTLNLLEAVKECELKRFLFLSTEEVYGANSLPYKEDQLPMPPSPYAVSKVAGENFCMLYHRLYKLPATIFRINTVYGPHMPESRFIPSLIRKAITNDAIDFNSGKNKRDYIYIDDLLDAIILSVKNKDVSGHILNIGTGLPTSGKDLAKTVLKIAGSASKINFNAFPDREGEAPEWRIDNSKAKKMLNWLPKFSLEAGLSKTIEHYREGKGIMSGKEIEEANINKISALVEDIYKKREQGRLFVPGKTWVQYSGSIFDDKEVNAMMKAIFKGWFGLGQNAEDLEKGISNYLGTKGSLLTNSGSSANFLAVASLMSPLLKDHLNPGDEVITTACGFPTTVNPIIQHRLTPVFLDVDLGTYNINPDHLEAALSKKTQAVMLAHTMGNPNEMDKIVRFCKKHNLFLIEDNCDSLGSEYKGQKTGSFGTLSTQSFYPPHHMTMGEGGMINFTDERFERIVRSLRDWGRACFCRGDEKHPDGACKNRLNHKINGRQYDHKYMFNQIGYNLKPIEPQAAMGVQQLKRLPNFTKARIKNFDRLYEYAKSWEEFFILPQATKNSDPSWFAFLLTIRDGVKFSRFDITKYLEEKMIQTRPLFAGNITRQPAYANVKYKSVGKLTNSDKILHDTFFIGVYPGLEPEAIDYIAENINDFLKKY